MREKLPAFHRLIGIFVCLFLYIFLTETCTAAETVFALTAPYPTTGDGISLKELQNFWKGRKVSSMNELVLTPLTLYEFSEQWGEPSKRAALTAMSLDEMLAYVWERPDCRALIPFEQLDPRWKVLNIDGISPFSPDFSPEDYPLSIPLPEGEASNFDPDKLTTVTLTGTTAMARNLAYHIETDGLLVPVENIAETLAASDITHISNESSFTPDCPPGDPLRREARFCSSPDYFPILEAIGADVIELAGNHNIDWGRESFLYSLDLYEKAGMKTYAGGRNAEEAAEPLLIEHHGNKIAFLGCNAIGPENVWAESDAPGAARCDLAQMKEQITALKADGWLPIVTFQHIEWPDYAVSPLESHDFLEIAREAAPVIVSGSQAHIPQGMTFVGDTFIHFGLGNLLFDQMSDVERTSFFDRHYFYDGRYIGNQLETIILENYSQPRFLDPEEREAFLNLIFDTCSWDETFTDPNE